MSLSPIAQVTGRGVVVAGDDIDTDRIIPARYMRCITFDGLGEYLFRDVRQTPEGKSTNHPIDDPKYKGAPILISGMNFGCGSSREHAPRPSLELVLKRSLPVALPRSFLGIARLLDSHAPPPHEKILPL